MPLDVTPILMEEGKRGVDVFIKAIAPYKATGRTAQSAFYKIEGKDARVDLSILVRKYIEVLESGSRKAKTQTPSKEMIDMISDWARARGIPQEAVWGIAKKLLRDGQKINRNVYSKQMDEWADEVIERVLSEMAGYVADGIVKTFQRA